MIPHRASLPERVKCGGISEASVVLVRHGIMEQSMTALVAPWLHISPEHYKNDTLTARSNSITLKSNTATHRGTRPQATLATVQMNAARARRTKTVSMMRCSFPQEAQQHGSGDATPEG